MRINDLTYHTGHEATPSTGDKAQAGWIYFLLGHSKYVLMSMVVHTVLDVKC
jgi:hypothetical protein